jgi:hypothetical protein
LVDEERQHLNQKKSRLTAGWLYRIVSAQNDCDYHMDPEQMLAKIEGYAPILEVDEKIENMLLTTTEEAHASPVAQREEDAPVVESFTSADTMTEFCENDSVFLRLHNTPVGSMDARDWEEAETALLAQADSQAFQLLDRLVKEERNSRQQRLTTEWFNGIIQVWCQKSLIDPTQLLIKLISYAPLPDTSTYDLIVSSIRRMSIFDRPVGTLMASEWAEADAMLSSWTDDTATMESVSSAWKLLDRLVDEEKYSKEASSDYETRLKSAWLHRIVAAWCKYASPLEGSEEATQVLVKMNRYAPHLVPDMNTYQMIIAAVSNTFLPKEEAKLDESLTVPETEANLDSAISVPNSGEFTKHEQGQNPGWEQATRFMYNKRINSLTETNGPGSPQKAEGILEEMWKLHKAGNQSVKPDTITYSTVIKVWGRSSHPMRAEKAQGVLERMIELHDAGDDDLRPDLVTFISVLAAWSRSRDPAAGEKADALFAQMKKMYEAGNVDLKPKTAVFNALLTVWSETRSPRAAERALAILAEMQELHDSGDADVKPDTISFNRTIKACACSPDRRRVERAERAQALLELMQRQYSAGDLSVKPNTSSFTHVLLAWSKCEDAGERAEAVLMQMEASSKAGNSDVKLETFCYNAVLVANVRSMDESASERAQSILDQMEELHAMGDRNVKPDEISYNSVVKAWARSGSKSAPERIETLLTRLKELRDAGDSDIGSIIPDTLSRAISVWVESSGEKAFENALRYLEELKNLGPAGAKAYKYAYEKVMRLLSKHPDDENKRDILRNTAQRLGTELEVHAPKGENGSSERHPKSDSQHRGLSDGLDKEEKSRLAPSIASG